MSGGRPGRGLARGDEACGPRATALTSRFAEGDGADGTSRDRGVPIGRTAGAPEVSQVAERSAAGVVIDGDWAARDSTGPR